MGFFWSLRLKAFSCSVTSPLKGKQVDWGRAGRMPRGIQPVPAHPAPDFTWALERSAEHPGICNPSKPEVLASLRGKID